MRVATSPRAGWSWSSRCCSYSRGAIVIVDSLRVGITWADDGPRAGYFPFYIGCLLAFAGA